VPGEGAGQVQTNLGQNAVGSYQADAGITSTAQSSPFARGARGLFGRHDLAVK